MFTFYNSILLEITYIIRIRLVLHIYRFYLDNIQGFD